MELIPPRRSSLHNFFIFKLPYFQIIKLNIIYFTMKKILTSLRCYLINMGLCIFIVSAFAALQYQIIQGIDFRLTNYMITFLVGVIFGFLIALIEILQKNTKLKKKQCWRKTNRYIPILEQSFMTFGLRLQPYLASLR